MVVDLEKYNDHDYVSARSFNVITYFELLFSMICFFHGSRLVKLLNVLNPLISCY